MLSMVVIYAAVALYPYKWEPPQKMKNPVKRVDGGLSFSGASSARTKTPPSWMSAAIETGSFQLDLLVAPATSDLRHPTSGPGRILTVSDSHSTRNLMLGQDRSDLVVRVRTVATDLDGQPEIRVNDVFTSTDLVKITVRVENGIVSVLVDDILRANRHIGSSAFANWNLSYRLALGNEFDPDREWLSRGCSLLRISCQIMLDKIVRDTDGYWMGLVKKAEIETARGTVNYVGHDRLVVPDDVWLLRIDPTLIPLSSLQLRDALINFLGFFPLGYVLVWCRGPRETIMSVRAMGFILSVIAIGFMISVTLELCQIFFAERKPSINDIILNTIGTLIGASVARLIHRETDNK